MSIFSSTVSIYVITTADKNNEQRNIQGFSVELNPVQGKDAGGLADRAVLNIMNEGLLRFKMNYFS